MCSARHPYAKKCWIVTHKKVSNCSVTSMMHAVINAFLQLPVRLTCRIVWLTVLCLPCQLQTCFSFPFRDFSRSCWGDVCGKGASWTPRHHFMGASEYFHDNTAVRSVWMCRSSWRMSNAMAALCVIVRQPITKFDAQRSLNRFFFFFFLIRCYSVF